MGMKRLMELIGKTGGIEIDGLTFMVKVEDVKNAYGKDRLFISPVSGSGSSWVNADRVQF